MTCKEEAVKILVNTVTPQWLRDNMEYVLFDRGIDDISIEDIEPETIVENWLGSRTCTRRGIYVSA